MTRHSSLRQHGRLFFAAVCVLPGACSLKKITVDQTAEVLADAGRAFDQETDPELAAAAMPASIKTIEGFLAVNPEQPVLLRLLAEAYVSYAFGFIEDEAERLQPDSPDAADRLRERALDYYLRARLFALRLLETDLPELAARLRAAQLPDAAELAEVDEDTLPALFWAANAWGAAINVGKAQPELVAQLPIVRAMVERCVAIDEGFYHAGPRLTLGALEAGLPEALGGRPQAARESFARAVELTGGKHLMTRVLFARAVGVQTGDRKLFETGLREVLAADLDAAPELALANRLAQRRARRYLAQIDELFLE